MADGLLSNRRQSILDLDRRSFLMALDELGISGADRDNLLRQYREQASPFSGGYSASRAAQEDIAARGRRPVAFGLLSAPAEATGWDAVRGLRPEVMASVLGLLEGIGKGIDAPASAGLIPASDAPMEALGTVGMAALGSMPARVPEGALRTFGPILRAPGGGFTTWHGSPHIFAAERLVRMPDGSTQYLVGGVDRLPDVPPGAQVIEDFPMGRFRMDKMGTGEGFQTYSPGLYVAEARGVGQGYRESLAGTPRSMAFEINGVNAFENFRKFPTETQAGITELQRRLSRYKDPSSPEVLAETQRDLESTIRNFESGAIPMNQFFYEDAKSALKVLTNSEFRVRPPETPGRLYEVDIAARPEQFLDWDVPLSAQPPAIRDALFSIGLPEQSANLTGEYVFRALSDTSGAVDWPVGADAATRRRFREEAAVKARESLREAGIPGVRYFDGGSRNAQEGTRNYVLYDEDLMRIVRVYGIAGAAAMLGMSTGEVEAAVQQAQGRSVPGLIGMPSDEQLQTRISAYLNEG